MFEIEAMDGSNIRIREKAVFMLPRASDEASIRRVGISLPGLFLPAICREMPTISGFPLCLLA